MIETLTNEEKIKAMQNEIPQPPQECELGGDIYYKCHWKSCDEDLKRWWRYCPACGQKILWKGDNY